MGWSQAFFPPWQAALPGTTRTSLGTVVGGRSFVAYFMLSLPGTPFTPPPPPHPSHQPPLPLTGLSCSLPHSFTIATSLTCLSCLLISNHPVRSWGSPGIATDFQFPGKEMAALGRTLVSLRIAKVPPLPKLQLFQVLLPDLQNFLILTCQP